MEPNELVRWIIALLTVIAIGAILLVAYGLITRRRVPSARQVTAPPPPSQPDLVAAATEAPPNKRLIEATAKTLQELRRLSPEDEIAAWVAVVPRVFNADVLAALRPEWASRRAEIMTNLQRLWFVNAMPDSRSCVQAAVRRAMLRQLSSPVYREVYQRDSLRAAKYFHARMVTQSEAYTKRNARFVSETFFRFLPPNYQSTADLVEWLYHLSVADPLNAQRALEGLGNDWLAARQYAQLQDLLDALREQAEENRLSEMLTSWVYYYLGCLAARTNRVREALSALEHARRLAQADPTLLPHIYHELSLALDVINPTDRSTVPDSSVWSALARPTANRLHWSLWADLQLPQPGADRLRRSYETLNVYQAAANLSGAGTMMRLIGDEHLARGDYRQALEWYQKSREMLERATRREGSRGSLLLDEALTLKALGDVQYLMGRSAEALHSYEAALAAHKPLPGDDLSEADTHKAKGDVLHFLGEHATALPEYEIALATYRAGGAVISVGETLLAQGRLLEGLARPAEAQRCYAEALEIYRGCNSTIGEANALLVIGSSLQLRGQVQPAAQRFEAALKIYRDEKNEAGEAAALKALGDASVKLKQLEPAAKHYAEALTQFKTAGLRRNAAETELAIGRLLLEQQDYEAAAQRYHAALSQFYEIEDRRGGADAELALSEARHLQRNSEETLHLLRSALATYRQTRDRFGEAQAGRGLGEEYLLLQNYPSALRDFTAALNLWQAIGDPIGATEELHGRIGYTLALLKRDDEAGRAFEAAAEARTPARNGWLGWHAIVAGRFDEALVHFTAITQHDRTVSWQIGLALATLANGKAAEAVTLMDEALKHANKAELDEAYRWCEIVARLAPALNLKPEQFNLKF